jgi:ankyrin repeat protein
LLERSLQSKKIGLAAFCLQRSGKIEDPNLIRLALHTGSASLVRTLFVQGTSPQLLDATCVIDIIGPAPSKENVELVNILLDHQIDPGAQQHPPKAPHQQTALLKAVAYRRIDLIEDLIRHGAKVNQPDESGWTPLHLAAQMGDLELLALLEKNGASRTLRTKEGKTPFDLASSTQAREALKKN